MLEIRFHGRGGQGAVFCANILAAAFFKEGNYVQAFPAFGMERRGAPVMAFLRVDEKPIRLRCQIYEPNIVIVLDATLMEAVDPTQGLKQDGLILINSDHDPDEYGLPDRFRTVTFNASQIALQNRLGTPTMPIVNTAFAGAFARITGLVSIDAVTEAVSESAPVRTRENVDAANQAYQAAEV
jgi:pyruvate ferredoxin oxidoreductase gamma subunit/2-oxoisovalerate ferredoxin oxidoreductase gamma subunit